MGCCHKGVGIRRDFQLKSLARLQHCKTYTNISIMHASLLESYEPPPLESHQTPITEYDQRQSIVAFSHWYRIRFGYHPTPIITYGTDMTPPVVYKGRRCPWWCGTACMRWCARKSDHSHPPWIPPFPTTHALGKRWKWDDKLRKGNPLGCLGPGESLWEPPGHLPWGARARSRDQVPVPGSRAGSWDLALRTWVLGPRVPGPMSRNRAAGLGRLLGLSSGPRTWVRLLGPASWA